MSKIVAWVKEINFGSVKFLIVALACVFGVVTIIAAPAVFAGDSPVSGGVGGIDPVTDTSTNGTQNNTAKTTSLKFKQSIIPSYPDETPIYVGANLTARLLVANPAAITSVTIEGNSVAVAFNPFKIIAVGVGASTITLTAAGVTRELTTSAIIEVSAPASEASDNDEDKEIIPDHEDIPKAAEPIYAFKVLSFSSADISFVFTVDGDSQPFNLGYEFINSDGEVKHAFKGSFIISAAGQCTINFWAENSAGVKYCGTEITVCINY